MDSKKMNDIIDKIKDMEDIRSQITRRCKRAVKFIYPDITNWCSFLSFDFNRDYSQVMVEYGDHDGYDKTYYFPITIISSDEDEFERIMVIEKKRLEDEENDKKKKREEEKIQKELDELARLSEKYLGK